MNEDNSARSCADEVIPVWLSDISGRYADLAAISDPTGEISFAELEARSARIAKGLLAAGVTKGAKIGILMPNGIDYLVTLFGALRIGAVTALMSTLSRPLELAQMIRTGDMDLLLTANRYLRNDYIAMLEEALPGLAEADGTQRLLLEGAPFLRSVWVWGENVPGWARPGPEEAHRLADDVGIGDALQRAAEGEVLHTDPALIIFTSGSSAEPKAVVHSHGNVVRQGKALCELMGGCRPGDRVLTTMPFFWVGGLCLVVLAAMNSGTAVLVPRSPSQQDTIDCLRKDKATHIMHWPAQLDLMRDDPEFMDLLAGMRPAYSTQYNLFDLAPRELTADSLGMTETLGPHSMLPMGAVPPEKAGSFGIAVGGIEHRIIDPDTGVELPPGEVGQLCLRGGALMIGMHRKAAREVFDELGFYRTDDRAMIDADGHLFFKGRGGDILKISGTNVSPVEVESAMRELPGVKGVCLVGLSLTSEGDTLVAAVIPEAQADLSADELRNTLKQRLSSYKVPKHFVFLKEEELPMTASSKIYKPALKKLLAERIAGPPARSAEEPHGSSKSDAG